MNISTMKGNILVIISAFIFGLSPVLIKLAYTTGITPITLSAFCYFSGIIFLTFYFLFLKIPFKLFLRDLVMLLLLGIFFRGGLNICLFIGFQYVSASLGELIFFLYPAITVLLAHFFLKEIITLKKGLAVIISFLGCFFVLNGPLETVDYRGYLLFFLAAIFNSLYVSFSSVFLNRIPPIILAYYTAIGTLLTFIIAGKFTDSLILNISLSSIIYIIMIGACIVLSMLFLLSGIKIIGASKAALLSTFEPVATIFISALVLSERLSYSQYFGAFMVIMAAILVVRSKDQQGMIYKTQRQEGS